MDGELDKNTKFYGRIEREDGSHYTEEFEFRFGLKHSFCAGRLFRRKNRMDVPSGFFVGTVGATGFFRLTEVFLSCTFSLWRRCAPEKRKNRTPFL